MSRPRAPMTGPLRGWVDRLESWLCRSGCCAERADRIVSTFKRFSAWMEAHGHVVSDVDEDLINVFVAWECRRSQARMPAAVQYMPAVKRFFAGEGIFTLRPPRSRSLEGVPRRDAGPLAGVMVDLVTWMRSEGYAPGTTVSVANTAARLGSWMGVHAVSLAELDSDVLQMFVRAEMSGPTPHPSSAKRIITVRKFLTYTGRVQVTTADRGVDNGPVEQCVQEWAVWQCRYRQVGHRWLAEQSRWVRGFLGRLRVVEGHIDWAMLNAGVIHTLVAAVGVGYSVSSRRHLATALRSVLRWAFATGRLDRDLAGLVMPVAPPVLGLPRSIPAAQVETLKSAPDRSTPAGRQEYAVVVLLARLGLRVGEVAGLRLDDIDWDHGQLRVSGKNSRVLTLPIPVDVGEALVAHLTDPRPPQAGRFLFYRQRPPKTGLTRQGIASIVTRVADRAGLGRIHAHQLRHTAATGVLAGGGSLLEAGELLGHVNTQTTMRYARVDLSALAPLAPSWGRVVS